METDPGHGGELLSLEHAARPVLGGDNLPSEKILHAKVIRIYVAMDYIIELYFRLYSVFSSS